MLRGSVVLSLRGRDRNSLLAVTGTDERFIYVADGKERPLTAEEVLDGSGFEVVRGDDGRLRRGTGAGGRDR